MTRHEIDTHSLLSHMPLFSALTPQQLDAIAAATREIRIDKGQVLFQKGDAPKGIYMIAFGSIKLALASASGSEKVVEIRGPRQSFGEAVMFMGRPYPVFAQALSDTLLLLVSEAAVMDLLATDASFARAMLAGMSQRLHSLIADVESYSLHSSTQRVIGYLLQHCPPDGECQGGLEVVLPTAKQTIASRLNLTPETLSRILHELSEKKLLDVHGRTIVIPDLARLREFDF